MAQRTLQVVIYAEGDGYVAQCLDVDVASEGVTEAEARAHVEQVTLKSA